MGKDEIVLLKDLIAANFTSVRASLEEKHDMQMIKMNVIDNKVNDIDEKVNKINGRVNKLEEKAIITENDINNLTIKTNDIKEKQTRYAIETKVVRFISGRPKLTIVIIVIILSLINGKSLIEIIKELF